MKRRAVLVVLLLGGCTALFELQRTGATAPITPRPLLYLLADTQREAERIPLALTRVSDSEEMRVGEEIARQDGWLEPHHANENEQRITEHLNAVGRIVALRVRRKAIHYHFYLRDDTNFVNAYAMPGGHIVVGRGLLELLESEDELAVILGHEIAHVDQRHAIERLQYDLASKRVGMEGIYQLGRPVVEVFKAGYTKEQELEADRVGLEFAVAAGYSPAGGVDVMKRFEKLESQFARRAGSPIEEFAEVPLGALEEYFRSHPPANERRVAMEAEIAARHWNASIPVRPLGIRYIFLTDAAQRLACRGDFKASVARFEEALKLNSNYVEAWRGLEEVSWRAADAVETARAATEAIRRSETGHDWELLARALSVLNAQEGANRLEALAKEPRPNGEPNSYIAARTELAGFKFLRGDMDGVTDFHAALSFAAQPSEQARVRREMAWWMYRAGSFKLAAEQLEEARQVFPESPQTALLQVWVLSDLGRQADARQILSAAATRDKDTGERWAVEAVLEWRIENKDGAKNQFREAAQTDPVWMSPQWVQNNYSPAASSVIQQLQAIESARRIKDLQDRQRAMAGQPAHSQ